MIEQDEWARLSPLLDRALDLGSEARAAWLEELGGTDPALAQTLRNVLARHASIDGSDFLEELPRLAGLTQAGVPLQSLQDLAAGAAVGPYLLEAELGRGGMAAVWRARRADGAMGRVVALKLPYAGLFGDAWLDRFARERDIVAALEHPHIARLYDAGVTTAGQPFLVLQYVDGVPITDYCRTHAPSVAQRLVLFKQVLDAVQYAHSRLVVHRDLKPSNILVTGAGQVQLLDFGIAKLLAPDALKDAPPGEMDVRALTPHYAAPEQLVGDPVTIATDVYSLGIILHELLTGARPHRSRDPSRAALEKAILAGDLVRPSDCAGPPAGSKALRGDLDMIVMKALSTAPAQRYATVDALAADLDNHLASRPVLARPDSSWYRVKQFLKRNALLTASTAAVMAALAVGLGVALWQAQQAQRAARRAETQAQIATAVQGFLASIFRANSTDQPDPVKAQATTARELLDRGAEQIERELNGVPEARLRALDILAKTYTELGLMDKAAALDHERIQLARTLHGPDSVEVAYALIDLSGVLQTSKAVAERESVLHEAQRILDARKEFSTDARGQLLRQLAQYYGSRNPARAVEYLNQALALYRLRRQPLEIVRSLSSKGALLQYFTADSAAALAALSEGVALCEGLAAQCAGELPKLYAYRGDLRFQSGEMAGAEADYRRGFASALHHQGPDHADTIQSEWRLGRMLFDTARTVEGLKTLKSALDRALRAKGVDDSFHVPQIQSGYGYRLVQMGFLEEGLDLVQQAGATLKKYRAGGQLGGYIDIEGISLASEGRYAEADQRMAEASALLSSLPPTDPRVRDHARMRVEVLLGSGRAHDGAALAAEAHFGAVPGTGTLSRAALGEALLSAECALATRELDNALAMAGKIRARIEADPSRDYLNAYAARAEFIEGRALLAQQRAAAALPLLRSAVARFTALYDRASSPVIARAQVSLAECEAALGNRREARRLAQSAAAAYSRHPQLGAQFTQPMLELQRRLART